jgi:hypothetical protein
MSDDGIVMEVSYDQGDEGGLMEFLVIVGNGVTGALVSFKAEEPNPAGAPIVLSPTPVTFSPMTAGMRTTVAAGYQSKVRMVYDPNGTPMPQNLSLDFRGQFVEPSRAAGVVEKTAAGDLPTLVLNVLLQNPQLNRLEQVAVSIDNAFPVLNTLDLLIHNPTNNPVIEFENPDGLTPSDPLPPISGPPLGPRLDRLYVYFPYGTTPGTLTTTELAAGITLSDNLSWYAAPQSSPTLGPYWILFPKNKYVMLPNESVRFVVTGLQTFNPYPTLTHMDLKKQITGYAVETNNATDLTLVDAAPQILTFDSSAPGPVVAGTTVQLSWTTWNGKTCALGSTEGLPANQAAYSQRMVSSTVYKLVVYSPSNKSSQDFRPVDVVPASIQSFTATPPQSRIGEPVKLAWQTSSAVSLAITPDVGSVCENADGCAAGERVVNPTVRTVYTLLATGGHNTQKTVTVFPLPIGWLATTTTGPWNTRDRPVLLGFAEQLWFMAGGTTEATNPIFASLDGVTWRIVTNQAPWSLRTYAGGVVFKDRMWLMGGGDDDKGTIFNDVWATTGPLGMDWTRVSAAAAWAARSRFGIIVYQDKIWIFGGRDGNGNNLNDVWSSADGSTWTSVTAKAAWTRRCGVGVGVFRGRLWLFGGQDGPAASNVSKEMWSSVDGATWTREPEPPWSRRSFANVQVFGERLYIMGGVTGEATGAADLWRMTVTIDGGKETIHWAQQPTKPQGNSAGQGSTQLAGGAWLAGGWIAPQNVRGPNRTVWLYAPTG